MAQRPDGKLVGRVAAPHRRHPDAAEGQAGLGTMVGRGAVAVEELDTVGVVEEADPRHGLVPPPQFFGHPVGDVELLHQRLELAVEPTLVDIGDAIEKNLNGHWEDGYIAMMMRMMIAVEEEDDTRMKRMQRDTDSFR